MNPTDAPSVRRPEPRSGRSRSLWAGAALAALALLVVLVASGPAAGPSAGPSAGPPGNRAARSPSANGVTPLAAVSPAAGSDLATRCPWLDAAIDRHESPEALARMVLARMTLTEKLGEIVLVTSQGYENVTAGVARLCIPPLTLQDGPQGLAYRDTHVTQLPAPLALAASFDTSLARTYGRVEGTEADGQGIDVIQGPDLNIDRVPQNGRSYESYGEDPLLTSAMGVADIEGIQSTGTLAMAKHFAVYSQETNRVGLDDQVSARALQEIYLPPFRAAVTGAHVATVMCAYPELNGTFQCQDPGLLDLLGQWGFTGVVRSDLGSVHDPVAALVAGTDVLKPASQYQLATLVGEGRLPTAVVDAAVTRVLTLMFAHGLVGQVSTGAPGTPVDSVAHTHFALHAAERSAVLLKDRAAVLPLAPRLRSLAVIGAAAATPVTTGYGSSRVLPPFVSTPLDAIRRRAGRGLTVHYADGGSTTGDLRPVPAARLTPPSGIGHGLALTLTQVDPDVGPRSIHLLEPTVHTSIAPHPTTSRLLPESTPSGPVGRPDTLSPIGGGSLDPTGRGSAPGTGRAGQDRSRIVLPAGWSTVTADWSGTLTPARSGLYTFSIQGSGAATLSLDGVTAVADPLSHANGRWSATVSLVGGRHYRLGLDWSPLNRLTPSGESSVTRNNLTLGWQYVSGRIAAAVAAARRSQVAVVVAADFSAEAFDRPSLSLPGDENALISAVAAANPRTVVVLDTGGPVLMPWLDRVAGVIEAWYPGEADGAAIAALLFGDVDPSGRLPVTFPAGDAGSAVATPAQWPGVGLTSTYSEGLDVGYRFDHATGGHPLFPFGYGLAYTRFALGHLTVSRGVDGVTLTTAVTDTGPRAGTDVVQAYLTFPAAAGEPPAQLVAFYPVGLRPGRSRAVHLFVPASAFRAFLSGAWTTVPGSYTLSVGNSSADLPLSASLAAP